MLLALVEALALLAFLAACLFGAAGRVTWHAAWAYVVIVAAFMVATVVLVPSDLVRERAAPRAGWDRTDALLASAGFLGLYPGTLIVAGMEAGRGAALTSPLCQTLAFTVFACAYAVALWAMRVNPFFSTFVRIQRERGHVPIASGPYAWVRHPGYAGTMVAHLALPAALGSRWAFVPALLGVLLFGVRTAHEDRVLGEQLAGYGAYRARVRWRLVPHLW